MVVAFGGFGENYFVACFNADHNASPPKGEVREQKMIVSLVGFEFAECILPALFGFRETAQTAPHSVSRGGNANGRHIAAHLSADRCHCSGFAKTAVAATPPLLGAEVQMGGTLLLP